MKQILALLLASASILEAEPFRPQDDSVVVERLPKSLLALQTLRSPLELSEIKPTDFRKTISLARDYLQIAQRTSDAAFVRYAQKLLERVQTQTNAEALFLGAVISQHQHEFDYALTQLAAATRLAPGYEKAELLKASILTTQGRYAEATAIFAAHLKLTSSLGGLTLLLNLTSLSGSLVRSEEALEHSIGTSASITEQAFAWCVLAEMSLRRGDPIKAEERFTRSLELEPGNSYALAAYCDLLLAMNRQREVLDRIESTTTNEALLTRRSLAANPPTNQLKQFAQQLSANGHLRELALLQLAVLHEPEPALENALANWTKQKEPIDALLVLKAALAAGNLKVTEPVAEWIERNGLEDHQLQKLLAEYRHK